MKRLDTKKHEQFVEQEKKFAADAILAKLPAGWESKNLQFVLHARVIGNAPALPEVVASHVW